MFTGEKTNTIDIGLINNGALNKVLNEFKKHIDADKITFTQVKKSKLAAKIEKAKETPDDGNVKNNNSANEGVTKKISEVPNLDLEPTEKSTKE